MSADKETGVLTLGKCMKGKHANCRAATVALYSATGLVLALALLGTQAWATSHTRDELKPFLRGRQKELCNATEKSSARKEPPRVT